MRIKFVLENTSKFILIFINKNKPFKNLAMDLSIEEFTADQLHDSSDLFSEEKLITHIHLGIKNKLLSVQWLASKMGLSERHLLRLFKKHFKMTCHKYLQDVKLRIAMEIIINKPSISIKEMSSKLMFSDTKYFSKLFRQKYGMNPSEFKQNQLKN